MLPNSFSRRFLLENAVYIVLVFLLAVACIRILLPFAVALTWSLIILIAVWPFYQFLCKKLANRNRLAAFIVFCLLAIAFVIPLALMVFALVEVLPALGDVIEQLIGRNFFSPPHWLSDLPVVGRLLNNMWRNTQHNLASTMGRAQPFFQDFLSWFLQKGASLLKGILEISLAIVVASILLVPGKKLWHGTKMIVVRLTGKPYENLPSVVVRTIRGVAVGIIGTALLQAILATMGLMIASVPGALALGFFCLILAIAQLPTVLVWGPAAFWLFSNDIFGMGIFLSLWGLLVVSTVDNFFKPYLISYEAGMPLSLIFLGVFGGLLSMGIIGLFVGPTLLAIAYTLIRHWLNTPVAHLDDKDTV